MNRTTSGVYLRSWSIVVLASCLSVALVPSAEAAPILEQIAPTPASYTFGIGQDFTVVTGTGFGDVTASITAVDVDLSLPTSSSGCEAADFSGFAAGTIALIRRGTCTFSLKALNAQAAGAVGVLLFNQGDTASRMDAIGATLAPSSALIPVFFASYSLGSSLALSPGAVLRMKVTEADLVVPEPSAVGLLALGIVGSVFARVRRRA